MNKELNHLLESYIDNENFSYSTYISIERKLKALEIIKNKLGNHIRLQRFFKSYVLILNEDTIIDLTDEEFNLLKEILTPLGDNI